MRKLLLLFALFIISSTWSWITISSPVLDPAEPMPGQNLTFSWVPSSNYGRLCCTVLGDNGTADDWYAGGTSPGASWGDCLPDQPCIASHNNYLNPGQHNWIIECRVFMDYSCYNSIDPVYAGPYYFNISARSVSISSFSILPSNYDPLNSDEFNFSWVATSTYGNSMICYIEAYNWNSGPVSCSSGSACTYTAAPFTFQGNMQYWFVLTCEDPYNGDTSQAPPVRRDIGSAPSNFAILSPTVIPSTPIQYQPFNMSWTINSYVGHTNFECLLQLDGAVVRGPGGLYWVNCTAPGPCIRNVSSGTYAGTHRWKVACNDMQDSANAGEIHDVYFEVLATPASFNITNLATSPSSPVANRPINFTWNIQSSLGHTNFNCSAKIKNSSGQTISSPQISCTSPNCIFQMQPPYLNAGSYTWNVSCTDTANGDFAKSVNQPLTVSAVPVTVSIHSLNTTPSPPPFAQPFNLTWIASSTLNHDLSCFAVLDGVPLLPNQTCVNNMRCYWPITVPPPAGSHSWLVNCTDPQNGESVLSPQQSFNLVAPPTTVSIFSIAVTPSEPASGQPFDVSWVASTTSGSASLSCNASIDTTLISTQNCANNTVCNHTIASAIPSGTHSLSLRCTDPSNGNYALSAYPFTIISSVSIILLPVNPSIPVVQQPFNFTWTPDTVSASQFLYCNVVMDGTTLASSLNCPKGIACRYQHAGASGGAHNYNITCNDPVSLDSAAASSSFTIESSISIGQRAVVPSSPIENTPFDFSWVATSAAGNPLSCTVQMDISWFSPPKICASGATCNVPHPAGTNTGTHSWKVGCTDTVTLESLNSSVIQFVVRSTPDPIEITHTSLSPSNPVENTPFDFFWKASSNTGQPNLYCTVTVPSAWTSPTQTCPSGEWCSYHVSPNNLALGPHSWQIACNDGAGTSASVSGVPFTVVLSGGFSMPSGNVSYIINQTVEGQGAIQSGSPVYSTGILRDWQILSIIVAILSLALVALARMVAEPLNMPDLKAWANIEWAQTFVTVVIVVFTVGVITFIDIIVMETVNDSPGSPVGCSPGEFCLIKVSNTYLEGLINLSSEGARESFVKSMEVGKTVSSRMTFSCSTLLIPPCFWGYVSWANNGFLILDVERYNQEIEMYSSIIYSLTIQHFFVNRIAYLVGPVLLLVGIVARSFFLTRRAGGLMMATGIGIMFMFPMMYLWNMISLNVTVFKDKIFASGIGGECPLECGYTPPVAHYSSDENRPFNYSELALGRSQEVLDGLANGSIAQDGEAVSCEHIALETNSTNAAHNDELTQYYCPQECRELPYPYAIPQCSEEKVELACMSLPRGCKVIRNTTADACVPYESQCPPQCRIVPPLNGGSDCQSCFVTPLDLDNPVAASFNCRIALMRNFTSRSGSSTIDLTGRPENCLLVGESVHPNPQIDAVKNCQHSLDEYDTCAYIMPDIPDCECMGEECCIQHPNVTCMAYVVVYNTSSPQLDPQTHLPLNNGNQTAVEYFTCGEGQDCLNYTGARFWNNATDTCSCLGTNCSSPSKSCEGCMNVSNDYCMFDPPVIPDCHDECYETQITKPALLTPAEFAKKSSDGMFGREDIKNVSRLLLPAYLLPLINIAVTLMFIRGFSPLFGGDIDLPGYIKVL